MTQGGLFMVHNSWTLAMGDRTELRSTASCWRRSTARSRPTTAQDRRQRRAGQRLDGRRDVVHRRPGARARLHRRRSTQHAERRARRAWNLSAYANAPKVEPAEPEPDLSAQVTQQLQMNRNRLRLFQI
jgi:ATP-dependent Clp protease protease subunit